MSFAKPKTEIEENDTVILYLSYTNMHAVDVTPMVKNKKGQNIEHIFQTHYGSLKVKDLIGVKYGSKVIDASKGVLQAKRPNKTKFLLSDFPLKRLGLRFAANTRAVDTNSSSSNTNHLHSRH